MELLQYILQLLRDGQPQVRGVLHQGYALVRDVEEDRRRLPGREETLYGRHADACFHGAQPCADESRGQRRV